MVSGRSGFALVATLVLGVAVTLLAHAALLLGTAQRRAAGREVRRIASVTQARADLGQAVRALRAGGPVPGDVEVDSLGPELLLMRAGRGPSGRVGLVWRGDLAARLGALRAGVEVDAAPATHQRDRIVHGRMSRDCAVGIRAPALAPWIRSDGPAPLEFGPIDRTDLEAMLSPVPPRVEGPVPAGPLGFAPHDVTLAGAVGAVGLWVDGSIEIEAGADVTGFIRATGPVVLRSGARFVGVVRSGAIELDPGSELEVWPCAFVELLDAHSVLLAARPLHPFGWPADGPGRRD